MLKRFRCPVAVHLVLLQDDKILLLRRQNTGFADGMYSVPAGCIEGDESVTQAMIREAREETGLILKPDWLAVSTILHRKGFDTNLESIVFFFTTTQYAGVIENKEPEKCSDLHFFSLKSLPSNMIPYVSKGVELTLKKIPFAEFGW